MFNKILVFGGITIILIIVFTNMVNVSVPVNFLRMSTSVWILIIISTIIGIGIGYGLKSMFLKENSDEDNYNF